MALCVYGKEPSFFGLSEYGHCPCFEGIYRFVSPLGGQINHVSGGETYMPSAKVLEAKKAQVAEVV